MTAQIDVLLPVKNGMPYLEAALQSLSDQTFSDFRVLVLDHGSTDGSSELVQRYQAQDPRFVHFPLPEAQGLAGLLNAGLERCTAPYVARQDADDISLPRRFERSLQALEADPEVAMVGTCAEVIDGDGQYLHDLPMPCDPEGLLLYFFFYNPIIHPTVMFSRAWLNKLGARYGDDFLQVLPPEKRIRIDNLAEDYFMFGQLSLIAKVVNLPEPLIRYRWHGQNTSSLKYVEQAGASVRVARFLADCFSTLHGTPHFDPAPFATPGHRLVRFGQESNFDPGFATLAEALRSGLPGHPGLARQLALRRVYANRHPLVLLARLARLALRHKLSREEWYPVYSYVLARFASQQCAVTHDNGLTFE